MQDALTQRMARGLSSEEATLPLLPVSIALPLDTVSYRSILYPCRALMAAAMQQFLKHPDTIWAAPATAQEARQQKANA